MQHSICTLNHVLRIFYFYSNFMGLCSQVKLSDYIGKKYVVLFFYPLDFTFVCPTGKLTLRTIKLIVYSTMYFRIYNRPHMYLSSLSSCCFSCRDHCFQWPSCRIREVKHRDFGCFNRQCGGCFSCLFYFQNCVKSSVWLQVLIFFNYVGYLFLWGRM